MCISIPLKLILKTAFILKIEPPKSCKPFANQQRRASWFSIFRLSSGHCSPGLFTSQKLKSGNCFTSCTWTNKFSIKKPEAAGYFSILQPAGLHTSLGEDILAPIWYPTQTTSSYCVRLGWSWQCWACCWYFFFQTWKRCNRTLSWFFIEAIMTELIFASILKAAKLSNPFPELGRAT